MRTCAVLLAIIVMSCEDVGSERLVEERVADSAVAIIKKTEPVSKPEAGSQINTGETTPEQLIDFAKSLIGTPYRYGSTDPVNGFDCSGFITYVFNHFDISVPRSSIDFTNYNTEVEPGRSKPGDLILFTGTDSTIREVGHMGIITTVEKNKIEFIHSTSGKANGVTITPLNDYYRGRFVKIIRVF
jgi:cell wall-associated NlpC family hydrolase